MKFEWDDAKNHSNIEKHGISFEQAQEIFENYVWTRIDDRLDYGETRFISVGSLSANAVVVMVHTIREDRIRIISARLANRKERQRYREETDEASHSGGNGASRR